MGNAVGAKCKMCRREGAKLFLKGERCDGEKCVLNARDYPPGMHRWRRGMVSRYGRQLREKQKLKRFYGVWEKQFQRYFAEAERIKGNTGENLLVLFERRLDNVLCLLGLAVSRSEGRQIIGHGHIEVNGRRVRVASYLVKTGDDVTVRKNPRSEKLVSSRLELTKGRSVPQWLERSDNLLQGKVSTMPSRDEISILIQEQMLLKLVPVNKKQNNH